VGRIAAAGPGVTEFELGQAVAALTLVGGHAEGVAPVMTMVGTSPAGRRHRGLMSPQALQRHLDRCVTDDLALSYWSQPSVEGGVVELRDQFRRLG
jgi:hypothetical protein